MEVVKEGTAKTVTLKYVVDTAGKTGTSGQDRDRFFIGYTPYFTAGIWCGYPNEQRGIGTIDKSHLTVWDEVMREIHQIHLSNSEEVEEFSTEGLVYLPFCKSSGELYGEICELDVRGSTLEYGYFYPYNKPTGKCSRHVRCFYDELSEAIANDGCDMEFIREIALLDIPERKFPKQIYITDAQYVWRKVDAETQLGSSYDVPYFVNTLGEGEFCGISKGKKQFNSNCYIHDS